MFDWKSLNRSIKSTYVIFSKSMKITKYRKSSIKRRDAYSKLDFFRCGAKSRAALNRGFTVD